jgi:hypothetical protein
MNARVSKCAHTARLVAIAWATGWILSWSAAPLPAAERAAETAAKPASQAVQTALREGVDGHPDKRSRLLEGVLQGDPDHAAARWHSGQVLVNHRWMSVHDVPALETEDIRRARYRAERKAAADTVDGQLALARWCLQQGLLGEARAHFTRVIVLSPEHPEARAQLGHRLVNGLWQTTEEQAAGVARAQAAAQALRKWRGPLEAIAKQFTANNPKLRELATAKLRAIRDADAVAALEACLAPVSEELAAVTVEVLGHIESTEAARALARQSLVLPWPGVRAAAAQQLKSRPLDTYVPGLLSTMYTPVESRATVFQTPGGKLMYRHLFYREGQDQRQFAVLDTEYRYGGGELSGAMANAQGMLMQTALRREQFTGVHNRFTNEINERACRTLASATGVNPRTYATENAPPTTPESRAQQEPVMWWNWWSATNETFVPEKEVRQYAELVREEIFGPVPSSGERQEPSEPASNRPPPPPRNFGGVPIETAPPPTPVFLPNGRAAFGTYDCLAAGTPVMTISGLTPVEKIEVGDHVLSQHPATGELAYKPVLRTSLRPASKLLLLQIGTDTIECTGGHQFWVVGQGWVKARDLQTGMKLHDPTGTVTVDAVSEGKFDFTYNLVVADFHTYCVGKSLLLNHDNTLREPTTGDVPGLAP